MSDPKSESKLTLKQSRFVDAYLGEARGNATEAARIAGYGGSRGTLKTIATENLSKPLIRCAIDKRQREDPTVMSNAELRKMWTQMAKDTKIHPKARLRASELLAKANGMFIERRIVDVNGQLEAHLVDQERDATHALLRNPEAAEAIRRALNVSEDVPN